MKTLSLTGAALVGAALFFLSGCAPKLSPELQALNMELLRADERALEMRNDFVRFKLFPGKAGFFCSGVPVILPQPVSWTKECGYGLPAETVRRCLKPLCAPAKVNVRRILLDPGHGGKDKGATGVAGTRESDLNLALAKEIQKALQAHRFTVIMTREADLYLPLEKRTEKTSNGETDLFISVHHNSSKTNPDAAGFECYALNVEQDAEESRACASVRLAWLIQKEQAGASGSFGRGVRFARFKVLRTAQTPAVLIEAGFLSCKAEEAKLNDPHYQQILAESVARAVKAFSAL